MALHGVAVAQVRAEVNEVVLQGGTGWEAAATEAVGMPCLAGPSPCCSPGEALPSERLQADGSLREGREESTESIEAMAQVCIAQWTIGINPRKAVWWAFTGCICKAMKLAEEVMKPPGLGFS